MKLERIAFLFFAAFLVLFAASQSIADIIVLKNGNYQENDIVKADDKTVTIKTQFGEQTFQRSQIVDFYQKEIGKPGSEYFRAGEVFAKDSRFQNKARELFEKAVQANPAYREQVDRILSGAGGTTQPVAGVGNIPVTMEILKCPVCNGEGRRQQKTKTMSGSEIDRVVPCYFCDQKGLKTISIPNGTRKCPNCGGWGYVPSTTGSSDEASSSSSSSGGATKKMGSKAGGIEVRQACFQCSGKGYIGMPKAIETVLSNPTLTAVATGGSVGYSNQAGQPGTTTGNTGFTGTGSMPNPNGSMPTTTPTPTNTVPVATTTEPSKSPDTNTTETKSDSSDENKDSEGESDESDDSQDESWFKNNMRLILIVGGAAMIVLLIVLSKSSKK